MRRNIIIGAIAVVVALGGIMLWRSRKASQKQANVQNNPADNSQPIETAKGEETKPGESSETSEPTVSK